MQHGADGCSSLNNCLEGADINICLKFQTTDPEAPYITQVRNDPYTSSKHIHREIELSATFMLEAHTPPSLGGGIALSNRVGDVYDTIGCEHIVKAVPLVGWHSIVVLLCISAMANLLIDVVVRIGIDCDSMLAVGCSFVGWNTLLVSYAYASGLLMESNL